MHNIVMKSLMTTHRAAILMAAFCLGPANLPAQTPAAPHAAPHAVPTPTTLFTAVGDKPAIVYDGPSAKANKIFILVRNVPLEVLVRLDKWTKTRDAEGVVGWLENSALGERRYLQVTAGVAEIRASPMPGAPLTFDAQRGVLLEISGALKEGWLPVRHRDGQSGFVRSIQVWGG